MNHIVMPFSRVANLDKLIANLEPTGAIWHPILDKASEDPFKTIKKPWIKPLYCQLPDVRLIDPCYFKLNHFVRFHKVIPEDWYLMQLCDDDLLPEGFFQAISSNPKPKAWYLISSNQGYHIPQDASLPHPARKYEAAPHNIRMGGIGSCRPMVKGEYLQCMIYANYSGSDQIAVLGLHDHLHAPGDVTYVTNTEIQFNRLQPGRWDNAPKSLVNQPNLTLEQTLELYQGTHAWAVQNHPAGKIHVVMVDTLDGLLAGADAYLFKDAQLYKRCVLTHKYMIPTDKAVYNRLLVCLFKQDWGGAAQISHQNCP